MTGDVTIWIPQPGTGRDNASDGTGTRTFNFLADLDTGRDAAVAQGYSEGMQTQFDGETYELARIRTAPHEEAYDMVTLVWQSIHGPAAPVSSAKKHKVNDEEWRLRVTMKSMSAQEALDKGYIASLSAITGDPEETTVHIPVATMERKKWMRGVKNDRALPSSASAALTKYMPLAATIGQALGTGATHWFCTDLTTDAEGALMLLTQIYEWQPKGYVTTTVPTP